MRNTFTDLSLNNGGSKSWEHPQKNEKFEEKRGQKKVAANTALDGEAKYKGSQCRRSCKQIVEETVFCRRHRKESGVAASDAGKNFFSREYFIRARSYLGYLWAQTSLSLWCLHKYGRPYGSAAWLLTYIYRAFHFSVFLFVTAFVWISLSYSNYS